MEENSVHAFLGVGPRENYEAIFVPPYTPSYQRFEVAMYLYQRGNSYPPASLQSIESLEVVIVSKKDEKEGGGCPICLDDWEYGDLAKETPCQHRYHGHCIRKWLATCGQCPVCKYSMPVNWEYVLKKVGRYFSSFGWPIENMRDNLIRFLIMNSNVAEQILYVNGSVLPLGAQDNHQEDV